MKRTLSSLLLTAALLLGLVPAPAQASPAVPFAAFAGETALTAVRSDEDYTYTETIYDVSWNPVGTEQRSVPLYTVAVPDGAAAVTLDFGEDARLAYAYTAAGDYAAACGDYGDGTQGKTTAEISDFTQFIRVQTPYDAGWNSEFLYAVGFAPETDAVPFAAFAGETALTAVRSDEDYTYTETIYDASWNPVGTEQRSVPLYTVTVPDGAAAVTLDFGEDARLAYAYTAAGDYAAPCGDYGDGTQGKTTAEVSDFTQFIRVQTPYDAGWNSEFLYAVGFEPETAAVPFAAFAGETALTAVRSDEDYTYTETIYDASWNPVGTEQRSVPLYTVTVPDGAAAVTLDFGQDARLAYAYTAAGDYAAACGDYGDGTQGKTAAEVTDFTQFIRVQTPYDAGWNSEFLYAVGFGAQSGGGQTGSADLDALIASVGAGFAAGTGDWEIITAGMYERLYALTPDRTVLQGRIDAIAARAAGASLTDADAAKLILALRACGLDPARVTATDGARIDLIRKLAATETNNLYNAPYVLLALQQGDYDAEREAALRTYLLDNQGEDGAWATSPDTTGIALTALAAYSGDAAVDAAMAAGRDYLLSVISPAGTCSSVWSSDNADTTAMTVLGLTAAGVDPMTAKGDEQGRTVGEGLLSFALADNSGFGYTDASARNEIATRDGFWGALCLKFGANTRLFDFTQNPAAPAAATSTQGGSGSSSGSSGSSGSSQEQAKTMTVTFAVNGLDGVWLRARSVKVPENATAMDVLRQVLDADASFDYVQTGGYLRSITYSGTTLAEFTEGPNSGWKYAVNGEAPTVGMAAYALSAGDKLTVYYVKDYTVDPTPDQGGSTSGGTQGGSSASQSGSGTTDPQSGDPAGTQEPQPPAPLTPFKDAAGHRAEAAIAVCRAHGIMNGTGPDTFDPDGTLTRGMALTILYHLEGSPAADAAAYDDVPAGAWYASPVGWATEIGLCGGYGGGKFGPDDAITAEQLLIILPRYLRYKGLSVPLPTGIPQRVTRADAAILIAQYLQFIG